MTKKISAMLVAVAALVGAGSAQAQDPGGDGNRYTLPRYYAGEVSAARAYLENEARDAVIVDVRTVEEYEAGHPAGAWNIPYPHAHLRPGNPAYVGIDPKTFFDAVAAEFPDRDTPIMTLCRTGHRSVLAANILANPGMYIPGYEDVPGYTYARNIWEGFVGNTKTDANGNGPLDLNNDGVIGSEDLDGWSNYQQLPYSTQLWGNRIYRPLEDLYVGEIRADKSAGGGRSFGHD